MIVFKGQFFDRVRAFIGQSLFTAHTAWWLLLLVPSAVLRTQEFVPNRGKIRVTESKCSRLGHLRNFHPLLLSRRAEDFFQ
jgi:hypothetical protein